MKKSLIVTILIIITAIGIAIWWQANIQPVHTADKAQKVFVINKGEGIREIAASLKNESLIRSTIAFFILVKEKGYDGKIQAGDFRLSPSMNLQTVADNLTHGTLDIWVTIPEGKRTEEIVDIFKDKLPGYDLSWKETLKSHEGHLFPDTYLIPKNADVNFVTTMMQNNFDNQTSAVAKSGQTNYTTNQIVTVASLIEREAKIADDRPLVASVIYNRLQQGMPLQIDAAVQYALGYQPAANTWWKKDLTIDDLKIDSPYNTYINPGLPPTPICNPGLSALKAAYNPAQTQYLYYISDKSGHLHYAKTLEEHNANIRRYGI